MNEPTHLDLFSGIGGFALAARWAGFRTVAFCEIDPYCQRVLSKNFGPFMADAEYLRSLQSQGSERDERRRIGNGCFGFHTDIHQLDGTIYRGVDLITGGFPCQPFSLAGKRRGKDDDRALWPQMLRVIDQARPAFVLGENVPGIINMELDSVLLDLESLGYSTRSFVVPACAVDAKHRRNRVWILGHAAEPRRSLAGRDGKQGHPSNDPSSTSQNVAHSRRLDHERRSSQRPEQEGSGPCHRSPRSGQHPEHVAHSNPAGLRERRRPEPISTQLYSAQCTGQNQPAEWLPEPDVGRVVARISTRMDGSDLSHGTNQILQGLLNPIRAQKIQWPVGGLGRVQTPEVLLSELCQYSGKAKPLGNVSLESAQTPQIIMRGVWFDGLLACPSCRSRSEEQRSRQHPDTVRLLSQLLACDCRATWLDPTGTPSEAPRVDRLKGLGNAVVPQVAYPFLAAIKSQLCHTQ